MFPRFVPRSHRAMRKRCRKKAQHMPIAPHTPVAYRTTTIQRCATTLATTNATASTTPMPRRMPRRPSHPISISAYANRPPCQSPRCPATPLPQHDRHITAYAVGYSSPYDAITPPTTIPKTAATPLPGPVDTDLRSAILPMTLPATPNAMPNATPAPCHPAAEHHAADQASDHHVIPCHLLHQPSR